MSRIIPVTNTIHIPSNKTEKKMQSLVVPSDSAYCPAITSFHSFEARGKKNKHFYFMPNLWSVLRYTNQTDNRIFYAYFLIVPLV